MAALAVHPPATVIIPKNLRPLRPKEKLRVLRTPKACGVVRMEEEWSLPRDDFKPVWVDATVRSVDEGTFFYAVDPRATVGRLPRAMSSNKAFRPKVGIQRQ